VIGFLRRAVAFYASYGITTERLITDNGNPYRSALHAVACRTLGIRHLRIRPYRPQTNGKAERFIRTLVTGWGYGAVYRNGTERSAALDGCSGTTDESQVAGAVCWWDPSVGAGD
jgi:transposase InsO family protein